MSQAKQMVKHSSIYAVGNISRQMVGFIMLPVYTHYLSPSDYGVIGLLVFLVSLFEIILGGHMFQAVPKFFHQENDPDKQRSVVSTAFLVTSLFSGFACVLMIYFSTELSQTTFGDEKYSIFVVIFSILILTHAFEIYSLTYIRILKKPWTFFNFNMAKLFFQLSLNIITIVVLEMGLMGLALSSLISSLIISCALLFYTISRTGITFNTNIAKKIIRFSWPLWLSGLIGLYIGSSNKYFIRVFANLDEVGLFELAAKFGSIVIVLIWSPFSQYWQTERFSIAKEDNPYPAYSLAFRMITALLLISGLLVSAFSSTAIMIMSAPAFHPALEATPFLVLAYVLQSLTIFNNFSFMYKDKTFEVTKNNLFTAAMITVFYFALIPSFGFVGASAAFALGSIAQYLYAVFAANRIYPLKVPQLRLLYGLFIFILAIAFDYVLVNPELSLFNLAAKSIISIFGTGLILIVVFKPEELSAMWMTMRAYLLRKG